MIKMQVELEPEYCNRLKHPHLVQEPQELNLMGVLELGGASFQLTFATRLEADTGGGGGRRFEAQQPQHQVQRQVLQLPGGCEGGSGTAMSNS